MTKKITGINPDFADFDEIDEEALYIIEEFEQGMVSFEELKQMVGHETARTIQDRVHGSDGNLDDLFDDPEDF